MPFNYSRSTGWTEVEVLKYPSGLDAIKSVVIDATNFGTSISTTGLRSYIPAGTILKLSLTNTNQYVAYNGAGTIKGILRRPFDLVAAVTEGDGAAAMLFHNCVFATTAIQSFTQYASALVADLGTHNRFE
jgi:hypothetical protein